MEKTMGNARIREMYILLPNGADVINLGSEACLCFSLEGQAVNSESSRHLGEVQKFSLFDCLFEIVFLTLFLNLFFF